MTELLSPLKGLPLPLARYWGLCAALALLTIWGFRYQAGLDYPQHLHLFALARNWGDATLNPPAFYQPQYFTPYLLTYALAYPFAKAFGAIAAGKVILSLCAILTPYCLLRWLLVVGGEKWLSLAGFPLAFGYAYLWGFSSFGLSLPVAFLAFELWERAAQAPFWLAAGRLALVLTALFLTHAMTFALVGLCVGILTLTCFRQAFLARLSGCAFALGVSLLWFFSQGREHNTPPREYIDFARFGLLFGAEFFQFDSAWAALGGLAIVALVGAILRPVLASSHRRWVPMVVALCTYLALPNYMMDTAFVGHRFVTHVHAFAPVAFVFVARGVRARIGQHVMGIIAVLCLGVTGIRVYGLNQEMAGLHEIAEAVPRGADLASEMTSSTDDSRWFGSDQLANVAAWVTAEREGYLETDHARFFQLPIRRRSDTPAPSSFRYVLGRGQASKSAIRRRFRGARLELERNEWVLFQLDRAPPLEVKEGTVVRWGQDSGAPRVGRTAAGHRMSLMGHQEAHGIGVQGRAVVQLRLTPGSNLQGVCGVDDAARTEASFSCQILDSRDGELFSGSVSKGRIAAFSIGVPPNGTVYLKTIPTGGALGDAPLLDWVF